MHLKELEDEEDDEEDDEEEDEEDAPGALDDLIDVLGRQHVEVGHVLVELLPLARQGGEDGVVRDEAAGVQS
jgi:hypothetical protein